MSTAERRAELEALERMQERVEPIDAFARRAAPQYRSFPPHMQKVLDLFELSRHQEVYATIGEPPRHGKSTACTVGLAYRETYDPACLNFYATYHQRLSRSMSRKVKRMAVAAGVQLSAEVDSAEEWETIFGGGLKATSVGGDVTGRGCNGGVIVADDIIKGRKAAESKQVRNSAWEWLRDDLMSRLEPGASLFVNMTRWHEDDVIGRLHSDPLGLPWIHIEFPAVMDVHGFATDERENPDARPLWPDGGYDMARYKRIRMRGERGWWSLYQQRPQPVGGGMFKRRDFVIVNDKPLGGRWVRSWDLAASTEADSAYTSGVLAGEVDGHYFAADMRRGQWGVYERDQIILQTAREDGHGVEIRLPQDPAQAGKSQKAYFAKLLAGYTIHFEREGENKVVRADPYASQVQGCNMHLVHGPWVRAFLDEHESFPNAKLKDQVDAMSGAMAVLIIFDEDAPVSGRALTQRR